MKIFIIAKVCLIFFLFLLVSYIYIGISTPPIEGDSLNYHIPIAKAFLNGTVLDPNNFTGERFLKYSPGSSEGILALFYLIHIPPNLFNVLGVILLFFALVYLGKRNSLEKNFNIIFATSIVTLNGIIRWVDTQVIDIYLAVFFVLSLALLQKPEKKWTYFLKLGICLGLLTGTKYSGILFSFVLLAIYGYKLIKFINLKNLLLLSTFYFLFGLSWYLRNFIVTGNPMYPQGFLIFKDAGLGILNLQVGKVMFGTLNGFIGTINAFISEYMVWCLSIPVVFYFVYKKTKMLFPFIIVGILNLIIYMFLPSDKYDYIMVSVIRYSYPAVIPFILGAFLLAQKYKLEEMVGYITLSSMFFISYPMKYNPKLIFITVPLVLLFLFRRETILLLSKVRKEGPKKV